MLLEHGIGCWRDNARHVASIFFCWMDEMRVGGLRVLPDGGPGLVMVRLLGMEPGLTGQAQARHGCQCSGPCSGSQARPFDVSDRLHHVLRALRRKMALVRTLRLMQGAPGTKLRRCKEEEANDGGILRARSAFPFPEHLPGIREAPSRKATKQVRC